MPTADVENAGKAFLGRDSVANYMVVGAKQLGLECFITENLKLGILALFQVWRHQSAINAGRREPRMAKNLNTYPKKKKAKSKLIVRLMVPMLLLVVLQLLTFFAIMIMGGEFSYVERYAYNTLFEKTQNRKNYIESELQQKMPLVQDSAVKMNDLTSVILEEQSASISDLQTDKELNRLIMESSIDSMVTLLRNCRANGVYLILDTGSLYSSNGGGDARAAMYLRDLDTTSDAGYEDLLMEMGYSAIAQEYGITLDSGWSLRFESDPEDMANFDYYYKTFQTAQENSTMSLMNLGYWSGFSKPSPSAAPSMKYTVPLIAEDGTVYGVLGIELTENSVLAMIPSNDFNSVNACYILGREQDDNKYNIITHSGAVFNRFVGNTDTIYASSILNEGVSSFLSASEFDLVGSIQYMNLYNQENPYFEEQWALISVADRESVLYPLTNLIRMLIISSLISVAVSILVIILSCREVIRPISNVISIINTNQEYSKVLRFQPSNIYEIDKMTDAITQMQINVQDFASQVSQMIKIANVGLGTFMYDCTNGTVFVGQSLRAFLKPQVHQDGDMLMSLQEFMDNVLEEETRQALTESLNFIPNETQPGYTREYSIAKEDGSTIWVRLSLIHNKNKSIGILQDITDTVMEKQRIEFERDYDSTTGLLNRRAYYQRIEKLFRDSEDLGITAFIMIDLDNLKYVNDTYGHDFGDDYIKTAATTLKRFQNYGGIVARLSGDEFNVCLPGFFSRADVWRIINEVREQLLQSYCLLPDGTHFKIRASAGISWYPDDAKSYEMLMKYADFAMYTIKHSTKGALAEFDRNTYEMDSVLITGVEEMNRIIDEACVRYAFQSIISARTGEIYGYEALMRPQSDIFQSPLELLRVAKTGAKLNEIELLTWTKALSDFQAQIDAGRIAKNSHLFINSIANSAMKPSDADFLEASHPDLLSKIVLEVLESENVKEEYNIRKLARMKKWNAQIALDDFGTGYNNDYALITLQPNIIKIDRSIVSGCDKDVSRRTIINNLVKIAQTKQILVLAEGVETEEELKTVISCGVDLLQGYYINRPLFEPQPLAPEVKDTIKRLAGPVGNYMYFI